MNNKVFKTKDNIYPEVITPIQSLILGLAFVAISLIITGSLLYYVIVVQLQWPDLTFSLLIFGISILILIMFFNSKFEIKQDEVGILFFMGNPIRDYYLGSGSHYYIIKCYIQSSPNKLNFENFKLNSISSYNKVMMNFEIETQWYNIDIFQNFNFQYADQKRSTENEIKRLVDNYISLNKSNDNMLINDYASIGNYIKENLINFCWNFGDELSTVIVRKISTTNPKRLELFESQSEIIYFIERIKTLARENNISKEDAFRIIAIKEGLISKSENIYEIKGIESILSMLK